MAARLNLDIANGTHFEAWRSGYRVLGDLARYTVSFNQYFPALSGLVGENVFQLVVEDVSPSPWNQPPFPPAGDTDTATCTVTVGIR